MFDRVGNRPKKIYKDCFFPSYFLKINTLGGNFVPLKESVIQGVFFKTNFFIKKIWLLIEADKPNLIKKFKPGRWQQRYSPKYYVHIVANANHFFFNGNWKNKQIVSQKHKWNIKLDWYYFFCEFWWLFNAYFG